MIDYEQTDKRIALEAEQKRWHRRLYAWGYKSKEEIRSIRARISEIDLQLSQIKEEEKR